MAQESPEVHPKLSHWSLWKLSYSWFVTCTRSFPLTLITRHKIFFPKHHWRIGQAFRFIALKAFIYSLEALTPFALQLVDSEILRVAQAAALFRLLTPLNSMDSW